MPSLSFFTPVQNPLSFSPPVGLSLFSPPSKTLSLSLRLLVSLFVSLFFSRMRARAVRAPRAPSPKQPPLSSSRRKRTLLVEGKGKVSFLVVSPRRKMG